MTTCAVLNKNNEAVNFIVAELTDSPPENCTLVELAVGASYGYGWVWDGTKFIEPNPPEGSVY